MKEGRTPDAGHTVAVCDAVQFRTVLKCRIPDAGDAVGDSNTSYAIAPRERKVTNDGNTPVSDAIPDTCWYNDIAAKAGVTSYCKRAVTIE